MILYITSCISVIVDALLLSMCLAELIRATHSTSYEHYHTRSLLFVHFVIMLLILSGLRLCLFVPCLVRQSFFRKPVLWSNYYVFWLSTNAILFAVGGALLLSKSYRTDNESIVLMFILLSLFAVLFQFCYVRNARNTAYRHSRTFTRWGQFNIIRLQHRNSNSNSNASVTARQGKESMSLTSEYDIANKNKPLEGQVVNDVVFKLSSFGDSVMLLQRLDCLEVLMQLYEYEGTNDPNFTQRITPLIDKVFSAKYADDPILKLFIPQTSIYIALSTNEPLADMLYKRIALLSQINFSLSHRMSWFIFSFCIQYGNNNESNDMWQWKQFLSNVEYIGEMSASKIAKGDISGEHPLNVIPSKFSHRSQSNSISSEKESISSKKNDTLHENIFIFRAINILSYLYSEEKETTEYSDTKKLASLHVPWNQHANYHLQEDVEQQLIPSYSNKTNASYQYHDYPLSHSIIPKPYNQSHPHYFRHNILFWQSICELSTHLFKTKLRHSRTSELHILLSELLPNFFPSSCIYAPIGLEQHRIFNIQVYESFAFSTKCRAPLFLCLEVVDYVKVTKREKTKKKWWKFPKRLLRDSLDKIVDQGKALVRRMSMENEPMSPLKNNRNNSNKQNDISPVTHSIPVNMNMNMNYGSLENSPIYSDSNYGNENINIRPNWNQLVHRNNTPNSIENALDVGQWSSPQYSARNKSEEEKQISHIIASSYQPRNMTIEFYSQEANNSDKTRGMSGDEMSIEIPKRDNSIHINVQPSKNRSVDTDSPLNDIYTESKTQESHSMYHAKDPMSPSYHSSESVHTIDESNIETQEIPSKPMVVFKENWKQKESRLRKTSPVGDMPGYRLLPVIIKTLDDLRQEQIISQLLYLMNDIFISKQSDCWIRPYDVVSLSKDSGIIEAIPDTVSLDALRKSNIGYTSLENFFTSFYLPYERKLMQTTTSSDSNDMNDSDDRNHDSGIWKMPDNGRNAFNTSDSIPNLATARENFLVSMAGYSIVCYLLQIKDRHNGNILLDIYGHIIHIDFGFVLGITPGGNIGFENAPFKLTSEMVEVLGGPHSHMFHRFRELCVEGFMKLRQEHQRLVAALDMIAHIGTDIPCFPYGQSHNVVEAFRGRFLVDFSDQEVVTFVHELIDQALDSWTTSCYDRYQRCCVGIF